MTLPDVAIESELPASLPPERPTALFLQGRAVGARSFHVVVDGVQQRHTASRMPRTDLGGRMGWWAVVPLPGKAAGESIELAAAVDGRLLPLATIPVVGRENDTRGRFDGPGVAADALIAVCMATYEPDPELFARQIESLRAQTDTNWVCVISDDGSSDEAVAAIEGVLGDDPRFTLSRARERQVFYRNFERALTLAPAEAELVALADQDDVWYPEKLATLRAALADHPLVYSDQRLTTPDGKVIRATLWKNRRPNHESMLSLLVAGGVTGAAMLMRREVADLAIPFPDTPGMDFHDHWIALVALALGDIAYVDRPLYDYVQHESAVFGGEAKRTPLDDQSRGMRWRAAYFGGYVQRAVFAQALLARLGERMAPGKRRALQRYLMAEHNTVAWAHLALRTLRPLFGRTETVGSEGDLAVGLLWRRLARRGRDTRCPDAWSFSQKRLRRWRWQA